MSSLKPLLILAITGLFLSTAVSAQSKNEEKKLVAAQKLKTTVDAKQYTFTAQTAMPMNGTSRQLTGEYSLKLHGDSLDVDLPFFGEAYNANPANVTRGGFRFRSTSFSYSIRDQEKGGWQVTILPRNEAAASRIDLSIGKDGYSTVQISSNDKQSMSFYGEVTGN